MIISQNYLIILLSSKVTKLHPNKETSEFLTKLKIQD